MYNIFHDKKFQQPAIFCKACLVFFLVFTELSMLPEDLLFLDNSQLFFFLCAAEFVEQFKIDFFNWYQSAVWVVFLCDAYFSVFYSAANIATTTELLKRELIMPTQQ